MPIPTWTVFDDVDYPEYVSGDDGGNDSQLRALYDNTAFLAADDGTGYASDADASTGYPIGSAVACYRAPVMWSMPGYMLVGQTNYHVMYLQRTYPYLVYHTHGAELVYTDDAGNEQTQGLTDTVQQGVIELDSIKGLAIGQLYYVRAPVASEGNYIAFAFEIETPPTWETY
jgi:hypothetical protein